MNAQNSAALAVSRKVASLRAFHVETERDCMVRDHLGRLLQLDDRGEFTPHPVRFTAELESRGLILIEPAGGGKTTAIQRVLDTFPVLGINPETGAPRAIRMEVRSPATQRSIAQSLLRELGLMRVNSKATVSDLFDLIRNQIVVTGTTLIWIDEAHDMFMSRSSREIDDMLKMLKGLMKGKSAVIVILSGTERLAELTSYDPQVSRRFTKIIPSDLEIGADNAGLEEMITGYCDAVGMTFDPADSVVSRLIHGSRKRFGRAVETVVNAIEQALLADEAVLERQHFADAWGMQEGCAYDQNVFVAPDWSSIELDKSAEVFEDARTVRQRRQLEKD